MALAAVGDDVFVYYDADAAYGPCYMAVIDPRHGAYRPRTGLTQGWVSASIHLRQGNSVRVRYKWPHFYTERGILTDKDDPTLFEYTDARVRLASEFSSPPLLFMPGGYRPKLSIITFRWGGKNEVVAPEQWGHTGSSCSSLFLNSFIESAVKPRIGLNYEVWSVFVEDASDLVKIADAANLIFGANHPARRAEHCCAMYFIYPTGFEENCVPTAETGEDEGAAHVDQKSCFRMMKAIEKAGVPTQFPHPSGFYELLTSKRWTHMMTLTPHLRVPPTVALPRMLIEQDCAAAAEYAQKALRTVKKQQAVLNNESAEDIAKADTILEKGVAKLGFSWEALDVKFWEKTKGLEVALYQLTQAIEISGQLTGQPHDCESLLIQEYCKHDIEMRLYVVNGKVEGRIYTKFCKIKPNNEFGDFQQEFDPAPVAKNWMDGDTAALEDGERQCREITAHWMAWVEAQICDVPPAIRFDYFIGRTGTKGKAVVWTLEICELGFSMLGEPDLPRKVFESMLHHCLDKAVDDATGASQQQEPKSNAAPKGKATPQPKSSDAGATSPAATEPSSEPATQQSQTGKGKGKASEGPEELYINVPQGFGCTEDQTKCTGKYTLCGAQAAGYPVWQRVNSGKQQPPRYLYRSVQDNFWYVGDDDEKEQSFNCNEGYVRCEGKEARQMPHELESSWEFFDQNSDNWIGTHAILCATEAEVLDVVPEPGAQGAGKSGGKSGRRSGKAKRR